MITIFRNKAPRQVVKGIFILFIIMEVLFSLMTHFHISQMNHSFLQRDAAIVGALSQGKPLEQTCILTGQIAPEDVAAGTAILETYSYMDAPAQTYDFYQEIFHQQQVGSALWSIIFALLCGCICLASMSKIYRSMRQIAHVASSKNSSFSPISFQSEGDFAALIHGFSAMQNRIEFAMESLKKDKTYLKDLLSDISHQLKTPLSALRVYCEILDTRHLSLEKQHEFLALCFEQLDRTDWLIQGLLQMARMDAGCIQMHPKSSPLSGTVQMAISSFLQQAKEQHITISCDVPEDIVLYHDKKWVAQALSNLIKNSLEHSKSGGTILISALQTPITVQLTIQDDGCGIAQNEIPHIFERFYRSPNTSSQSVGIGLSLARQIIEQNDGDIFVQSTLGRGSTFVITFLKH